MSDRDKQSEMERRALAYEKENRDWHRDELVDVAEVYKQGWTDALKHAPEVQRLADIAASHCDCDLAIAAGYKKCSSCLALTAYQKAIEEQK